MVVVCGKVNAVERAATKTTYHIEDHSGTLEVVQWVDEGSAGAEHNEGDEVKVVGSVRTQGEKKHVMAFKISAVSCKAEWDAHILQVVYAKLKLRQLDMNNEQLMELFVCRIRRKFSRGLPDNWTYQLNDGWSTWDGFQFSW